MKELRILITSPKDVTYASCWIKSCIILHAFCIDSELEINEDWLNDGVAWEHDMQATPDDDQPETFTAQLDRRDHDLAAGRAARENLNRLLQEA